MSLATPVVQHTRSVSPRPSTRVIQSNPTYLQASPVLHQSQKSNNSAVVEMGDADMCPKHKGIPLYFHCKSHNIKICHSCVVIDHPASSCNLVSIEEVLQEKKQSHILTIQKQKQVLVDTEKDLETLHEGNIAYMLKQEKKRSDLEKEMQLLLNEVEEINQTVERKENSQRQIKEAIKSCQERRGSFVIMENNLRATRVSHELEKQFSMAKNKILENQEWENIVRREMNVRKNSASCSEYVKVDRNGTHRSSKIFKENGRAFVPSLSKAVNPPASAQLRQVVLQQRQQQRQVQPAQGMMARALRYPMGKPSQGLVFIDVSLNRSPAGRVVIQLNPQLPKLYDYMMKVFTMGHEGAAAGAAPAALVGCDLRRYNNCTVYADTRSVMSGHGGPRVTPASAPTQVLRRGDVVARLSSGNNGYLRSLCLQVNTHNNASPYYVVGIITTSMNVLDDCHKNCHNNVKITATGLM